MALLLLIATLQEIREEDSYLADLERRYEAILRQAERSVVAVHVTRKPEEKKRRNPFSGVMGGDGGLFGNRPEKPAATGVVVGADLVLTTYFNISGDVEEIYVQLPDGGRRDATVKGYDAVTDIALLELAHGDDLAAVETPRERGVDVGQAVVAVGISPGRGLSIFPGIVSARDRVLGWGIQHDAKLNYGNVGGPLFDLDGRLVALTTGVSTERAASTGQNSGVGEALLWSKVSESLEYLKKGGKNKGAYLGIEGRDRDEGGVNVDVVQEGMGAAKYGVKANDIIVEFDGKTVNTMEELRDLIKKQRIGDEVTVTVERGGERVELKVVLGERPENE